MLEACLGIRLEIELTGLVDACRNTEGAMDTKKLQWNHVLSYLKVLYMW